MRKIEILVVDDDPVDRELIARAFGDTKANILVHYCGSGDHAITRLKVQDENNDKIEPDACIFDINMPGMSGIELLQMLKSDSALRKIPVLMLSSSADEKDVSRSYDLQASGYVQKPDTYGELRKLVANIAQHWQSTVRFPARQHAFLEGC